MKLQQFEIVLEDGVSVYQGGQIISGHVVVKVSEAMKIKGVSVTISGQGYINMQFPVRDIPTGYRIPNPRGATGVEDYFRVKLLLSGTGSDTVEIQAGRHVYPFRYQLPPDLPMTFEMEHCEVRYLLEATVHRPWMSDHHIAQTFLVLSPLDLNTLANVSETVQGRTHGRPGIMCCKSGPISAVFRLDRTGFVPGETINFHAEISNQSNRGVTSSKVCLLMVVDYCSETVENRETFEFGCLTHGTIDPGDSDTWSGESLVVPRLPPTHLPGSKIIDIRYFMQLFKERLSVSGRQVKQASFPPLLTSSPPLVTSSPPLVTHYRLFQVQLLTSLLGKSPSDHCVGLGLGALLY